MEDTKPGFFSRIINYVKEVNIERHKVTWPARKELYGSTVVLIFVGFLLTIALAIVDFGFGEVLTWVIKR